MSAQIAVHAECSSGSRTVGQVAEVLIVDDNPIDRLRAGRLIDEDPRCHATYAEDGTQALAHLANHPTSVVLTDLQMEGMDGLSL
ncbi:MAG: response regulator, partial [Isosphaeraceae bacterium]